MLTANEHQDDTATDLSSGLAQPFEAVCSALATKLTAQSERFDDLSARLSAMQRIVTRTMCDSSRDWNRTHDRLRVLPMELRAMCWSYLPQTDLVGLACVCSSWRDLSRSITLLWTTLNVTGPVTDLDLLFSRSGRQPFDVSVTVHSASQLAYVDDCVRKHADRVRALHISVSDVGSAQNELERDLFRYPVPVLGFFSFKLLDQVSDGDFQLPDDIFDCHAPNLRSLTLHGIPLPAGCPAFSHLTELTLQWHLHPDEGGLQHAFTLSPGLERLALLKLRDMRALPPVPASSKLRKITLTVDGSCFSTLRTRGYLDVPHLEVTSRDPRALFHAAKHPDSSLRATLSIASAGPTVTELVLRGERGRTAMFTADNGSPHTPTIILDSASLLPTLHRLVIPTTAPHARALTGRNGVGYPYLPDELRIPALRTLALAHGAQLAHSIFDPTFAHGVVTAPCLSRLEIVRAASCEAETLDVSDAINPGLLAVLIEQHVECEDPAALELYISAENVDLLDVADEEGMARLRDCVGKIIYGDSAS